MPDVLFGPSGSSFPGLSFGASGSFGAARASVLGISFGEVIAVVAFVEVSGTL